LRVHYQSRTRIDTLDSSLGDDVDPLVFQPALQHAAADRCHHRAKDLTRTPSNDRQMDAAFDERLHADAGNETRAHHDDLGSGPKFGGDHACIFQCPASHHSTEIGTADGRQCR
jgi:hypothetical protein